MFGLTFEKLFLVAIVAAVVIGPQRLPLYAARLAETVRSLRDLVESSRTRAEAEMGISLQRKEWAALDVRQYDPRRIVREALDDDTRTGNPDTETALLAAAAKVRPGQRYVVAGSAAHPRRIAISSLPLDDPRRIAASTVTDSVDDRLDGAVLRDLGDVPGEPVPQLDGAVGETTSDDHQQRDAEQLGILELHAG